MSAPIRFRSYVRPHVVDAQTVAFLSESTVEAVSGRIYPPLASMLSENKTLSQIIAQMAGSLDVLQVVYGVGKLRGGGWINEDPADALPPPLEVLRESLQADAGEARRRLELSGVAVRALAGSGTEDLEALLQLQGLRVSHEEDAAFLIVVTDDVHRPELDAINAAALAAGRPWMLVRPFGSVVWSGPVFQPGRGPCWACLASGLTRVRAAWGIPEAVALPLSELELAAGRHAAWSLAVLEAAKWLIRPPDHSRFVTFDLKSCSLETHTVLRREDCLACGNPASRRESLPLLLAGRGKALVFDGGYRAAPPEETYARYEHLIGPLTGIVHSVERVTAAGTGVFSVYAARHNFQMSRTSVRTEMSFGKGITEAQARTGALCEALEAFSGIARGDEPLIRASLRDLGETGIHPKALLGFSERQYEVREEWNRLAPPALVVPEPFDENEPVDWTPAWSLTNGLNRLVPAAYCWYDHPAKRPFCWADSNGNAAGASIEDAVLQGLFELIERDAIALWWYNRARRPAVAISIGHDDALRRQLRALGRGLSVLDLTTDLGVSVFVAVSAGTAAHDLLLGFGANFDPMIAYTRALTELEQGLAIRLAYGHSGVFFGQMTDRAFLEPDSSQPTKTIADFAAPYSDDLRSDVMQCVELLRGKQLEVLVVDQTRAAVGLPVVKVIVPGLRHFWRRLASGRLNDVPAKLGWVERPLREEDLNTAHPIL